MTTITLNQLNSLAPRFSGRKAASQKIILETIAPEIEAVLTDYQITSPRRICHFLAQLAHESAGFRTTEEFASGSAYEGRKDLGNTQKGDGKRYKGRGLIQLTGRYNYRSFGKRMGVDLENHPMTAAEPVFSLRIACEYWKSRGLNKQADRGDLKTITKRINGGYNGLDDRRNYLAKAKKIWGYSTALAETGKPSQAPAKPQVSKASSQLLEKGSRGPNVEALQHWLNRTGYSCGKVDSVFGRATQRAVLDFQAENDLATDGKVRIGGPTWTALSKALAGGKQAEIAPERSAVTFSNLSKTSRTAGASLKGASAGGVTVGLGALGFMADKFEEVKAQVEPLLAPFGGLSNVLIIGLIGLAAYMAWQHLKAGKARLDDERSGRIL